MARKFFKDASIVFLSICVVSCSLKSFNDPTPEIKNNIPLSDDLFNPDPAITPSFVDSAFCTGEFGGMREIEIYETEGAKSLCEFPPSEDLRGIQFASLNISSRSAVGRITAEQSSASAYQGITLEAAYAGLSPYIDHTAIDELGGSAIRSLYHNIAADKPPIYRDPFNCRIGRDDVDQDCIDNARINHDKAARAFKTWETLSIEDRLAYMGISHADWSAVSYHMIYHDNAYETNRAEKKAKRRRFIGVVVAVALTVATAGSGATLGATFASSISGLASGTGAIAAMATVAVKASVALGGMVVAAGISAFTTLIVTGDFKLALKALGAVFQSRLEDAIIQYALGLTGISPANAKIAMESYKSGDVDGALKTIGVNMIGEYGHDVLEGLVDETNGLNGFEAYIKGLAEAIDQEGDDLRLEDAMVEYTAKYMGGYIASFLHITSPKGLRFVEEILNEGLSSGNFDADTLKDVFVDQVKFHADGLPDFIKQKLGGTENAEGVMSDVVAESLLEAPEEIDRAKEKLEQFIDRLKEKYNRDPAIGDAVSEEVSKLYEHILSNGIGQESVKGYLSEHFMVEHLVTTYTSDNVAQNGVLTAMDYAEKHNLDLDVIESAMMEDVIETAKNADIPDEIKFVFGGDGKVIAEFQTSFAIRLAYHRNRERGLSSEELVDKVLSDLDFYGEKFADGYVGTYDAAMISAALGSNVDPFLREMTNLYANGNQALAVQHFKDNLLTSLNDANIDLETFDNEEIMDVIQSGINVLLSKGTPPQMLDAMGNSLSFYSQRDVCHTCN